MGDLVVAFGAGAVATLSMRYFWGIEGSAEFGIGAAVGFFIWFVSRLNRA
ncbi:MAG TPA: hypothetical protein VM755_10605 [Stellaceae bacterium]|nr:hypothetical protein [Stellaceae bacterium]